MPLLERERNETGKAKQRFFFYFFTQRSLHIIAPHTGINKMWSVSQILGSETALHKKTAVHVYQVKQEEKAQRHTGTTSGNICCTMLSITWLAQQQYMWVPSFNYPEVDQIMDGNAKMSPPSESISSTIGGCFHIGWCHLNQHPPSGHQ